jgi:hypothetical protein
MCPAFSSTRQAAGFALLLLLILLSPELPRRSWLPPRQQVYAHISWGAGAFPYLHDQIFEETGDIDIAFMGPSRIFWGIDTPQVQEQLTAKLGRKAVVRSLCWSGPGLDVFYFVLQDLLEHRKVRVIVFPNCTAGAGNFAQLFTPLYFRMADNAAGLAGLPFRVKLSYYANAILGTPRDLLEALRPNLALIDSDKISWPGYTNIANPAHRLGSLAIRESMGGAFEEFRPQSKARPEDVCVYSEATSQYFRFSGDPITAVQSVFARKIGALARAHGVKLVYLHMPQLNDADTSVIPVQTYWPDLFGQPVTMMGVPCAKLFAGMADQDIRKLFYNYEHFNQNGQQYFTSLITPALIRVYEEQTEP